VCDCRRGMDRWINLLATYKHHSQIEVITAPPIISVLYKSVQHALNSPACRVFNSRSLATVSNNEDYSAPRAQVIPVHRISLKYRDCPRFLLYNHYARTIPKTQFFYCYVCVCFRGIVFTGLLLRIGRLFIRLLHSNDRTRCLFRDLCLATDLYTWWRSVRPWS
jgi:hypothetical protein